MFDLINRLFSIQGNQGDRWINAKIDLPPTTDHYDFIFEGVVVCASIFLFLLY